jgi:hypothetical protein
MNTLQRRYTLLVLVALVGCAQLGIPTPTTFNEKFVVVVGATDEVVKDATLALQAKKITPDDAQNVVAAAETAKSGLTIARSLSSANPAAADAKLTAVKTAVTAVQAYLISRGK